MYAESLSKTIVIKYGNWIVNRSSLSGTNKQSVNVFFDASRRLFSGFVNSTTTQCLPQSLQHLFLKKPISYQFRKQNLEPVTWRYIYRTIHCANTNCNSTSNSSSSDSYQQESPELRDILNELYKESDIPKYPPNNSNSNTGNNGSVTDTNLGYGMILR